MYKLDSYLKEDISVVDATWLKKWGVDTQVASSALKLDPKLQMHLDLRPGLSLNPALMCPLIS